MKLEQLRNKLLTEQRIQLYELFLSFMRSPETVDVNDIVDGCSEDLKNVVLEYADQIMSLYISDRASFHQLYTYGQVVIWQEVLLAYKSICKQCDVINSFSLPQNADNYSMAVSDLKRVLLAYASIQNTLSDLEESFGVDRFLDRISTDTFAVFNNIIRPTKQNLETKIESYKKLFQDKWNSTNVNKTIVHKLIRRDDNNQVCDQFTSNNKQCIFLLVDGLGFCQYLWNTHINAKRQNYAFKENVFYWLSESKLSREMILGSSFITDTGSGLSQIYFGQRADQTRVLASKLREKYSGRKFVETKRMTPDEFDLYFEHMNSITNVISSYGYDSKVYYCSKYPEEVTGFSKSIFDMAKVEQVLPPERVFSVLLEDIDEGMNTGLQIVYLTGIDNSGHTMGAYSRFERMEHEKLDGLFRNFLIELAFSHPDLFDNQRSIILSADHGMFESSNLMISRNQIVDHLKNDGIHGVKLIENNRALLVYNEGHYSTDEIKSSLERFFISNKIVANIAELTIEGGSNSIIPDLAIRFVSEGLFYSNERINSHLLHFGGHGGYSIDEVFIPFIEIPLTTELLSSIDTRFLSKK